MLPDLAGKVAVVTGGASGIGKGIAEDAGAVVVRAIKRGDLYALTHPDWYPMVAERHAAIAAAFRQQAADAGLNPG